MLLLSVVKILIIVVLFITLASLKQLINLKILFLKVVYIYKKVVLIFSLLNMFFYFFFLSYMIDSMGIYKSLNISIGAVMRNPDILKVFPNDVKTKKMCKYALKKLPYLLRYVPDQLRLNKCVLKLL